jgi:hypothetical protein
LISYKKK